MLCCSYIHEEDLKILSHSSEEVLTMLSKTHGTPVDSPAPGVIPERIVAPVGNGSAVATSPYAAPVGKGSPVPTDPYVAPVGNGSPVPTDPCVAPAQARIDQHVEPHPLPGAYRPARFICCYVVFTPDREAIGLWGPQILYADCGIGFDQSSPHSPTE